MHYLATVETVTFRKRYVTPFRSIGIFRKRYVANNFWFKQHVRAWCNRIMHFRLRDQTTSLRCTNRRWTILPPSFYNSVLEQDHHSFTYADGSRIMYPSLWEVDTVYLPVSVDDKHWCILCIDMQLLKVTVYYANVCNVDNCDDTLCIHRKIYQILTEFESAFIWFLGAIKYWEYSSTGHLHTLEYPLEYSGDIVWPYTSQRIGRNSGVIICMLLKDLALDNEMTWDERSLHDACMKYRRYMADEIYAARFSV